MTKERFEIPRNISAVVTPTTKIIDEAVSMTSGFMVHPGYKGHLFFVLKNLTQKAFTIKRNIEFLRIKFSFSKIDPERIYAGSKQNMTDFPDDFRKRFCDSACNEI
jgi:deoxycytidine triphosphate deaminase